ncbi:MAG TPA: hypothetical protein VJ724_13855, partial [Tahibacter sp.]|nr:hypothetical protein [Tahibacter sp.]
MLSTSDAILYAAPTEPSEPVVHACAGDPPRVAPARQLRPSLAFALSFALHAAIVVALWQWAPTFVPTLQPPPLD